MFAVTDKQNCQKLRELVEGLTLYDGSYKCKKMAGEQVGIPVREAALDGLSRSSDDPPSYVLGGVVFHIERDESALGKAKPTAAERLRSGVTLVMKGRGLWLEEMRDEVPRTWEKYGDLVVFSARRHFLHSHWALAGDALWDAVCSVLKVQRIALRHHIHDDAFRSPALRLVRGDSGWVQHRDNGILYSWDVTRSMFCAGNAPEKQRIARLDCRGETVVDMFAGIGYFTLPFLVHARASCVHACEWSPYALHALRYNLEQNCVSDRCVVHAGDCNQVCPARVADRVSLGLLPSSRASWSVACAALKDSGGTLHIHECVPELSEVCAVCTSIIGRLPQEDPELAEQFLQNGPWDHAFTMSSEELFPRCELGRKVAWKRKGWWCWGLHAAHIICGALPREEVPHWRVHVSGLHHVKSYAPHIDHLVLDLYCEPLFPPKSSTSQT